MRRKPFALLFFAAILFFSVGALRAEGPIATRPKRFAIIYNQGYAGDRLPQSAEDFKRLVQRVKAAGFNTILCKFDDRRAEICKEHDVQIFVDLLTPEHHVYKNVEAAQALCTKLRGNDAVYAYHLWSDNIGNTYPGRSRDAKNVRGWDPTHPVYVGTYRMSRVSRVEGVDLLGYYDFHWKRGGHWPHVARASQVAKAKDAWFLRYCDAAPGRIGIGNVNRVGYTIATSIPFGLKGYLFHFSAPILDRESGKLTTLGEDLKKINERIAPMGDEVSKIGNPLGVYSTPVTKTAKDRPTGKEPAVPDGLAPLPADHWFAVESGEVLVGEFEDSEKRSVLAFAGHNAYQPQETELRVAAAVKSIDVFDRESGKWRPAAPKNGRVTVTVPEYALELVRVGR